MLGGMISHKDAAWFFKVTGPPSSIEAVVGTTREFLKSIRFSPEGRPEWTLPPNWKESASPTPLRYKTLVIAADPRPLELTVSELAIPKDPDEFAVSNINRWRGQLGLSEISAAQLETEIERLECPAGVMLFVDLSGTADSSPMAGMPGVAGNAGRGKAPTGQGSTPSAKGGPRPSPSLPFQFETPDGWEPGGGTSMSLVSFQVMRDGQQITTTVTPAGGDVTSNINRWRGQIRLKPQSEQEIAAECRKLVVDQREAIMVQLVNEQEGQAILAAIIQEQDISWFIKMTGHASLAMAEQPNFEKFVQSIRFKGK